MLPCLVCYRPPVANRRADHPDKHLEVVMTDEKSKSKSLKSKLKHEFEEMLLISAFFGLFFFAFATYKMYLLHEFRSAQFTYVTALINTLVLAKIILIGDFVRIGKVMEHRPLIV